MPEALDEQTFTGAWWRPDREAEPLTGTLTLRDGRGHLELLGSWEDLWDGLWDGPTEGGRHVLTANAIGTAPPVPLILGAVDGHAITLVNVRSGGFALSAPGMQVSRYRAGATLVGVHLTAGTEPAFRRARFRFDVLNAWACVGATAARLVATDDGRGLAGVDVTYRNPPHTLLADGDVRVTLVTTGSYSQPTAGEHRVRQNSAVVCDYTTPAPIGVVADASLRDLHGVLTLLSGHPARVDGIDVWVESERQSTWAALHVPLTSNSPRDAVPRVDDMPLPLPLLGDHAPIVFAAWFSQRQQLDAVLNLFAAVETSPGLYLETEFLFRAQALESLHRRTDAAQLLSDSDYAPVRDRLLAVVATSGYDEDVREALESKLKYLPETSLRKRLRALVGRVRDALTEVFSPDARFVSAVVDTRNYLTHYDARGAHRAAQGARLYALTQQLRVLLLLALLQQLGLPTTFLRDLCRGRQWFLKARHSIALNATSGG